MKDKILTVYTGGTICSFLGDGARSLDIDRAKSVIIDNFEKSNSAYASLSTEIFVDSKFKAGTLSENMTVSVQSAIIDNIKSHDLTKYKGVIVLHGTDTLAYTASLLAVALCDSQVPVMLVSANRPPDDPMSNTDVNFRTAVELIMNGIAPNVYAVYRNSDGEVYLHAGAHLMQCANFSEDFHSATADTVFPAGAVDHAVCRKLSKKRGSLKSVGTLADDAVLLIHPYPGLDYSRISLDGIKAIVHGTYHSGTVCVERSNCNENYDVRSILHLADRCRIVDIPIYMVPCVINTEQYSSAFDASENGGIIPLSMTVEATYAKAIVGVSMGYAGDRLTGFMKIDICGEMM